ncbi:MAG: hypothetical protein ABUK19_05975 [Desulfobacteria bacterium]
MGVTVRQKVVFLFIFLFAIVTTAHAGQYEVTWVYDGDTIKAQGPEGEIRVRLMGIDAPETSKKKGREKRGRSLQIKLAITWFSNMRVACRVNRGWMPQGSGTLFSSTV